MNYSEMVGQMNAKHSVSDDAERAAALRSTPTGRTLAAVGEVMVELLGPIAAKHGRLSSASLSLKANRAPNGAARFGKAKSITSCRLSFAMARCGFRNQAPCSAPVATPSDWQLCCEKRGATNE